MRYASEALHYSFLIQNRGNDAPLPYKVRVRCKSAQTALELRQQEKDAIDQAKTGKDVQGGGGGRRRSLLELGPVTNDNCSWVHIIDLGVYDAVIPQTRQTEVSFTLNMVGHNVFEGTHTTNSQKRYIERDTCERAIYKIIYTYTQTYMCT